ncbi:MAG TPA: L-histidine N(alpha)-methyltransferase [Candidatus Polarisedimenticolia bacterium]|nr:L-histidine N(alpha)-methyltransferase [Candidatus Polarisedimenticolia bacterium]
MSALHKLTGGSEEDPAEARERFALDVLMGLSTTPKQIASKYFYDEEGTRLFEAIMRLPEYYPTECERQILASHADRLVTAFGEGPFNLAELGSGDGLKTKLLLRALQARNTPFRYLPIDISGTALEALLASLDREFPGVDTEGLIGDYFQGLRWLTRSHPGRTVVLFLGSNIGNFSRAEARVFLHSLWNALNNGDRILIGFDLKKDIDIMLHAYNDSQGVTRDFNLNLLTRINRELGGDFNVERFRFFSTYDVFGGSMNSYLVSQERQEVFIEAIGQSFEFKPWEPIRTEFSYKYLESDIKSLAAATNYKVVEQFYDARRYFTSSLWQVCKETPDGRSAGGKR